VADPLFWLALSFLLVVISLTVVLMVAIPAFRELGRAARSAEKLFDTLGRELPPTLEAIRLTGLEITELTDDMTEGVQGAGQVVQQVSQSLATAQTGAQTLATGTRSAWAGARAAWRTLTGSEGASGGGDEPPEPTAVLPSADDPPRLAQGDPAATLAHLEAELTALRAIAQQAATPDPAAADPGLPERSPQEVYPTNTD
jgi:hypothetical protein